MRFVLVVVGVAVMVIGAVLLVIPAVPNPAVDLSAPPDAPGYEALATSGIGAFSLTDQTPISGSWSSNTSVLFELNVCSALCKTPNATVISSVVETGTSGTFTVDVPQGDIMNVSLRGATGTAAHGTVNFSTALTLPGSAAVIVGIVLIVLGYLLRTPRRRGPPARGPPARARPTSPPTITVEPTRPSASRSPSASPPK